MRIKPFKALRPASNYAGRVASPPYDTLDRNEAEALACGNPFSFLRVTRAEIEFPETADPHGGEIYEKGLQNFRLLRERNILIEETEACLYVYRMIAGEHVQVGVAACCHVDDYASNIIKKHENTRREKEDDRARLTSILNAHTGPVLLTYADSPDIDAIIAELQKDEPLYDVVGPDGVAHTIWRANKSAPLAKAFEAMPASYIADGHHRAAAAVRVAMERRACSTARGAEEYDWFLAVLFPASQLRVLPYNRCVRDLAGMTTNAFLEAVRSKFHVVPRAGERPEQAGHAGMYLDGQWYDVSWEMPPGNDPVSSLDVSVLQKRLLEPILGIRDPRTDKRIEYIGGSRGTEALKKLVACGEAAVAFSMFPVSVAHLMTIADAGGIMPPKSTWFDPKPLSGLLVHAFAI